MWPKFPQFMLGILSVRCTVCIYGSGLLVCALYTMAQVAAALRGEQEVVARKCIRTDPGYRNAILGCIICAPCCAVSCHNATLDFYQHGY